MLRDVSAIEAGAGQREARPGVRLRVKLGYALRKGSDVTLAVGSSSFKLFVSGDRAYVADATEELKLLEAMRKGSTMTVQGTSERGTSTTDTYSLAGISQALAAVASNCK